MSKQIANLADAALEQIKSFAEEKAADAGQELSDALKRAASHGQELAKLALNGDISASELSAAVAEVKETIEGVIAAEAYDTTRETVELLKGVALRTLQALV